MLSLFASFLAAAVVMAAGAGFVMLNTRRHAKHLRQSSDRVTPPT